jgi:RimJ/RimL family protein N-acetyltransferase
LLGWVLGLGSAYSLTALAARPWMDRWGSRDAEHARLLPYVLRCMADLSASSNPMAGFTSKDGAAAWGALAVIEGGRHLFAPRLLGYRLRKTISFDLQPHLVGHTLELRPLRETDFDDLYAVASAPLIWEQHPVPDRYRKEFFREFFTEHLASGGALVAIDRREGRIVGTSRFHGYDVRRSEVEIGWTFLARSHWGGSYNGEMKGLMLEHAFRFVSSVVFLIHPENVRSQRAIEKIGAVRVGTRLDGGGRNSLVYKIRSAATALSMP